MIKNIILDVGRVLVAWQPKELMKELGVSDEAIAVLAEALFSSGVWNEADRGVMSDEEFLEFAISKAPEYNFRIFQCLNQHKLYFLQLHHRDFSIHRSWLAVSCHSILYPQAPPHRIRS